MSDELRLGLVGCGRIAERGYLAAIDDLPQVAIVAVADPDPARAGRVAAAAGAAAFADAESLVAAGQVDALVVAAPVERHLEIAQLAAAADLPSLVEKPPASDVAGALALAALDPAPYVAFNRRFQQGEELAPAVPAEGWLELRLELCFQRRGWGAHVSHDEAILDAGIHLIDLAAFLTDSAPIAVRRARLTSERAELELELGRARATIRAATDRPYCERVEVRDRGGRIVASTSTGRLRGAMGRLRGSESPLVSSIRRQVAAFAAVVGGDAGTAPAGSAAAVAALAVVDAARRSAELGGAEVTVAGPALPPVTAGAAA